MNDTKPNPKDTMIMSPVGRDTVILPANKKSERRQTFRSKVSADVEVTFSSGLHAFVGQMLDISPRGVCIIVPAPSPSKITVGETLDITFILPDESTKRNARLVRWQDGIEVNRLSFAFTNVDDKNACLGILCLDHIKIDPAWALRVSPSLALRRQIVPFAADDAWVYVACREQLDPSVRQALEKSLGMPVRVEIADPESLRRTIDRVYGDWQAAGGWQRTRSIDLRTLQSIQPEDVVGLCDEILHAAIVRLASDIHIDPEASHLHVRFRVDGVLDTYRRLPANAHNGIVSRFKVMAGMDIAEKRAPQDGGFKHRFGRGEQSIDLRVATLPTKYGERMTLRLLALQTETLTLERLGMSEKDLVLFEHAIDRPHGMILLTGPTGSGKSTTLYAAIRRLLQREGLNIITVEDPIEYEIPGVAQTEIDQADKVTFLKALRSVLRHDPDVVMIGEIRDAETADVAIKASLTGHLVFSTLHTNSAASVVTRLADMGVDRYLIAATLRLAVAQRLVRKLCPRCRTQRALTQAEAVALQRIDDTGRQIHEAKGCIYCGQRGYTGRLGLFELLPIDDDLGRLIAEGGEEGELMRMQREKQESRLVDDGFDKILRGSTSVREVLNAVTAW